MKAEVIKKHLHGFNGDAWLVKFPKRVSWEDYDGKHSAQFFVISGACAMFSGWEVLVFPANSKGEVSSWVEVAGGRGISHEEAISELEEKASAS